MQTKFIARVAAVALLAAGLSACAQGTYPGYGYNTGLSADAQRAAGGAVAGAVIAKALDAVGLPEHFAEVANTSDCDDLLRGFHATAMDAVGDDVGTPVVKLGDNAFFGPVITRVPEGEEAGKLFDHAVGLAEFPYFFELKRTRTEIPQVR